MCITMCIAMCIAMCMPCAIPSEIDLDSGRQYCRPNSVPNLPTQPYLTYPTKPHSRRLWLAASVSHMASHCEAR